MTKRSITIRVRIPRDWALRRDWTIAVTRSTDATDHYRNLALVVVRAVAARQVGYFRHGPRGLAAMTLQDIAGDVGTIHYSTVARVSYCTMVDTVHGQVLLSDLFSRPIKTDESISCIAACAAVERILREGPPMSDQNVCVALRNRDGIEIARRTVTKYRTQLNIAPSRERVKA